MTKGPVLGPFAAVSGWGVWRRHRRPGAGRPSLGRVVAKKKRRSRVEPVTEADLFVRELER